MARDYTAADAACTSNATILANLCHNTHSTIQHPKLATRTRAICSLRMQVAVASTRRSLPPFSLPPSHPAPLRRQCRKWRRRPSLLRNDGRGRRRSLPTLPSRSSPPMNRSASPLFRRLPSSPPLPLPPHRQHLPPHRQSRPWLHPPARPMSTRDACSVAAQRARWTMRCDTCIMGCFLPPIASADPARSC